jgi:pimeloyl-ACP methyl ester carboxylesterase/heat shock protein HslJ
MADEEIPDQVTIDIEDQINQFALVNLPPQLSDKVSGIEIGPCQVGVPVGPDEVEGETYYCGTFTVPMDWNNPDRGNLDLGFIVIKATGENPEPDPLIYLAGGPGQSAVATPALAYDKLRSKHDILRLDQRGVGISQRLNYEECLVLAAQTGATDSEIELLLTAINPPIDDESGETMVSEDAEEQIDQICWEQFSAQDLDLNQFTTAASARDVVELVKALDYSSFNIHGISYGTRLAMTIMNDLSQYEDAPELRSVVLDSAFPPSIYLLSSLPRNDHDPVLQLLEDCWLDDACHEAYPNLEERLGVLLNELEQEPIKSDDQIVTVEDVVSTLTKLSGTRSGYMPKMIAELENDVLDTYLSLLNGEIGMGFPEGVPGLDRSDPVQVFIGDSVALIGGNEDIFLMFEYVSGVDEALGSDDPQRAMADFINQNYSDEVRDQLLEKLDGLTVEDFANTSYVPQFAGDSAPEEEETEGDPKAIAQADLDNQRALAVIGSAQLLYKTIHCIEDIQFETFEDVVDSAHQLKYPQLASLELAKTESEACVNWPVEAVSREIKNAVSSDIPALILQGAYDNRTPVYMGKTASAELENSTYVLIPQQGHEVWINATDCASRIATAFVMDPTQELDLSCLETRMPRRALPTEIAEESGISNLEMLLSQSWQWVSFTSPVEQFNVEMSESYLLTFNDDATVDIIADCNNASGNFTADESSLLIEIGPMTMATCQEGSRSEQFVQLLGNATIYFFQDGQLFIDLFADGGTLEFAPAN